MTPFAELVLPAIRWDPDQGFAPAAPAITRALAQGVGGFILFGGERGEVQRLTRELRAASPRPLLIASDLERGAGQQVRGLTPLPPALALAGLGEHAVRAAARITALEARDVGINWALAPVCDVDLEPANPIVLTRSFGADTDQVGHLVASWVTACQDEGVLACAKHFPGHGRTTLDSHATLPVVEAARPLLERDLAPFRRAVAAGVGAVMTAHVAYPALDPTGAPATRSRPILDQLLRRDLFFSGLVVTDALIMEGARQGTSESEGAVRTILSGADLLLYPQDVDAVLAALADAATADRSGFGVRAAKAAQRREQALELAAAPAPVSDEDLHWHRTRGHQLAIASLQWLRGEPVTVRGDVSVEIVDDDAGGPYPLPPRSAFADELRARGVDVRPDAPQRVVLVFADVKSWKGRAGLSAESRARLAVLLERPATVVCFGHPRRLAEIPGTASVLCAWSGDAVMQHAAAKRLVQDGG
jgi:beta-glucosidase